ncbi:hypothetical protein RQP46_008907 [Phenoliferia psychrophenolica]
MSTEVPCAVCTAPGTLQCSRCRSIRFCGPQHQALLWSSHKLICKPNAPLVFGGRQLDDSELQAYAEHPRILATIDQFARSGYRTLRAATASFEPTFLRKSINELSPIEHDHYYRGVLVHNIELPSPPHAAFAYATTAMSKLVPTVRPVNSKFAKAKRLGQSLGFEAGEEGDSTLVSILDGQDADVRNAIELQVLVLYTLVDKEAAEDLIELALSRVVELLASGGGYLACGDELFGKLLWTIGFVQEKRGGRGCTEVTSVS